MDARHCLRLLKAPSTLLVEILDVARVFVVFLIVASRRAVTLAFATSALAGSSVASAAFVLVTIVPLLVPFLLSLLPSFLISRQSAVSWECELWRRQYDLLPWSLEVASPSFSAASSQDLP